MNDDVKDIVDDLRESATQTYEELTQATIDVLNRAADALEASSPTGCVNVRNGVCLVCGDGVLNSGKHIEPERHHRQAILNVLGQGEHAPMYDHDERDGSCRSCPWPVHALGPEVIADRLIAAGVLFPETTEHQEQETQK